jgi:hypothetical protein
VNFVAITLYVASQRVFVVVYFVMDSVRKLLDKPSYSKNRFYESHRGRQERRALRLVSSSATDGQTAIV